MESNKRILCEDQMQKAQSIVEQLESPVEVKLKFQKIQEYLKRNAQLIVEIERRHQHSSSSQHGIAKSTQMIQELNSNLTEIVKIYASLTHVKELQT
mmetsp:Transcript_38795/g.51116  ORF Transcript_38795/g.51116 Transcript_38795/m.51116 type:complete len:97 (+) Transcript_38795:181-471(+)